MRGINIITPWGRSAPSSPSPGTPSASSRRSPPLLHRLGSTVENGQFVIAGEGDDGRHSLYLVLNGKLLGLVAVDAGQGELAAGLLELFFEDGAGGLAGRTPSELCRGYSV